MAAMIRAAGAKGKRFASPNAEVMIHQSSGGFKGQTNAIRVYAEPMQRQEWQLVELLARWRGKPSKRILKNIENDYFMTAEVARDYGIMAAILEPFHAYPADVAAK